MSQEINRWAPQEYVLAAEHKRTIALCLKHGNTAPRQ